MITIRERHNDESTLGGRLRSSRKKMRYTIEQAAELLDISIEYLGVIERNNRRPSLDLLIEMHHTYDASSDYLLFGSESYPPLNPSDENGRQFPLLHKLSDEQFETVLQIAAIIHSKKLVKYRLEFLLTQVNLFSDYLTRKQELDEENPYEKKRNKRRCR